VLSLPAPRCPPLLNGLAVREWREGELGTQRPGVAGPVAVRITGFGLPSQGGLYEQVVPLELAERLTYDRWIIAQRCL
jgi:hypothetical protein